jgi:hypothetical protein
MLMTLLKHRSAVVSTCGVIGLLVFVPLATADDPPTTERVYYDGLDEEGNLVGGFVEMAMQPMTEHRRHGFRSMFGGPVVTTVIDNGDPLNRIDAVFVGDGYQASDLSAYNSHCQAGIDLFFSTEPLASYAGLFNVHRVDVISNESGVDNDPTEGIDRDTALDMRFWCGGTERLLCVNTTLAWNFANYAPDADQILAVANSSKYGGAGYSSSEIGTYAGGNGAAAQVALHELGHSLGNLADEYSYGGSETYSGGEPSARNISIYDASEMQANTTKWHQWLNYNESGWDGPVGTFEGASYSEFGIFRASNNSLMRNLNRPFNLPSGEGLIIELYKIVDPIDDATPLSPPLVGDELIFVDPVDPGGSTLDIQWSIDGVEIVGATGETFDLAGFDLATGDHAISVKVVDNTSWVRDEAARASYLSQTRTWEIDRPEEPCIGDINGDLVVDLTDFSIFLLNFGLESGGPSDLNNDLVINLEDFSLFLVNYGRVCSE